MKNFISEDNIEQALLKKLGEEPFKYEILKCDASLEAKDEVQDKTGRSSVSECVLPKVLLESLKRINPTYRRKSYSKNNKRAFSKFFWN